ncbi:MAG: DUF6326 family protein [Anaerolineaceae bacterium]
MNTTEKNGEIESRKVIFSTVWIFAMLNYIYCDIIGHMDVELLRKMVSGEALPFPTSQEFWLGMAVMMEIPIAMVLLSRVLKYRANRWANIIAGAVMTLVQISSNFVGTPPTLQYIFYSVVEIASTIFITVYAWRWRKPKQKAIGTA